MESAFQLHPRHFGLQEFSGVHQPGKDHVILLRHVAQFLPSPVQHEQRYLCD